MTDHDTRQLLDPAFHEGIVELTEGDEVVFAADEQVAPRFTMPASIERNASPIPLVTQVLTSRFAAGGADRGGRRGAGKGAEKGTEGGQLALAALKLGWDIVKDNRPQSSAEGASSAILAPQDMAWNHYAAAKPFASKPFTYRFKNKINVQCVSARYRIRGSYGGQYGGKVEGVQAGYYLPSVEVYPDSVDVAWAWNLNAGVQLSQITDVGPVGGPVDPWLIVRIWFTRSTIFSNTTNAFEFKIQGSKGYLGKA